MMVRQEKRPPCPRCSAPYEPGAAERYWEARWRDEAAIADELLKALKSVEAWWLETGYEHFSGAPYAIFAARAAIAKSRTAANNINVASDKAGHRAEVREDDKR